MSEIKCVLKTKLWNTKLLLQLTFTRSFTDFYDCSRKLIGRKMTESELNSSLKTRSARKIFCLSQLIKLIIRTKIWFCALSDYKVYYKSTISPSLLCASEGTELGMSGTLIIRMGKCSRFGQILELWTPKYPLTFLANRSNTSTPMWGDQLSLRWNPIMTSPEKSITFLQVMLILFKMLTHHPSWPLDS